VFLPAHQGEEAEAAVVAILLVAAAETAVVPLVAAGVGEAVLPGGKKPE